MDEFEADHEAYTSSPGYPAIEAKAKAKGFRKATAAEVRASAQKRVGYPELYCAFGGLWVKEEIAHVSITRHLS